MLVPNHQTYKIVFNNLFLKTLDISNKAPPSNHTLNYQHDKHYHGRVYPDKLVCITKIYLFMPRMLI